MKDYSLFENYYSSILNTNICIDAFQKKQEFGGAKGYLNSFICNGKKNVGINSQIIENKKWVLEKK